MPIRVAFRGVALSLSLSLSARDALIAELGAVKTALRAREVDERELAEERAPLVAPFPKTKNSRDSLERERESFVFKSATRQYLERLQVSVSLSARYFGKRSRVFSQDEPHGHRDAF